MARKTKRVSHMKTAEAKVKIHLRGKRMELTIVLPHDMEQQLTKRLNSPKRFGKKRSK